MSLNTMSRRMSLEVPGVADKYAATLLGEALGKIEDERIWSFQLAESGWLTPGLQFAAGPGQSAGTVTFTPYSNQVVGDATATAAWAAYVGPPFLTAFQIRSPSYSLYNIVGYTVANGAGFGVFTLDRPWMEPGGVGQSYMIYQAYFAAPVADFKRFFAARDTTDDAPMDYWSMTQKDLAFIDPQRTNFSLPAFIVPYETDMRPNSSTLGYMLYELWPHPISMLPYSFSYLRRGPQLVIPSDTVPFPITEEAVLWRAKEAAYMYKEAQKGEDTQRGSGADYRFLSQAAHAEFVSALKPCKMRDQDLVDLYFSRVKRFGPWNGEPFATTTGQISVGDFR